MRKFKDELFPFKEIKKYRRCSRGFVFDGERIALLHIKGEDEFGIRDHYETPGGGLEGKETYASCFKREIGEELGIIIDEPIYLETVAYEYNLIGYKCKAKVFYAHKIGATSKEWTKKEQSLFKDIKWKTIDEWISLLENNLGEGVNYLVQERDLYLLRRLKTLYFLKKRS